MNRNIYIDILYKPMLNNFKPIGFSFGNTKNTNRHYIFCKYNYIGSREIIQTGQCVLAYTPFDMQGTHKIIGLTEDGKQIKLRKLRQLPSSL